MLLTSLGEAPRELGASFRLTWRAVGQSAIANRHAANLFHSDRKLA